MIIPKFCNGTQITQISADKIRYRRTAVRLYNCLSMNAKLKPAGLCDARRHAGDERIPDLS
ncbi:MAG: hypothetical protein NUV74_14855 [Candidatus Brocadiaceae bacterium]|nr:hypothetical protein [Candidatus Brocadiaceae bacterium]